MTGLKMCEQLIDTHNHKLWTIRNTIENQNVSNNIKKFGRHCTEYKMEYVSRVRCTICTQLNYWTFALLNEMVGLFVDSNNQWIIGHVLDDRIHKLFDCFRRRGAANFRLNAKLFDYHLQLRQRSHCYGIWSKWRHDTAQCTHVHMHSNVTWFVMPITNSSW